MHGIRGRDLALAAGLTVLVLVGTATSPPGRTPLDPVGYLLAVIPALALAARGRAPLPVLVIGVGCLVAYHLRGYPGAVPTVPVLFALHAAVDDGHRRVAVGAIAVVMAGGYLGEFTLADNDNPSPDQYQRWFLLVGWLVAAAVAGEVSRQRRANIEQAERRAADAERTREETARRRADEERLRIARELHDSLTHSISIIKVQAGVAVHLAGKRDEPPSAELLAIQQASGEAMRELRATLEVLRGDDRAGTGLDRLDTLIADAGLPVTVTVRGQRRTLPAPVDLAAYRIIQEALTNITRHAGPASVSVLLEYRDTELTVYVDDDGRGTDGGEFSPGVGLAGMRERVTALGGSLSAGPARGGGFRVHAALPVPAAP